MNKLVLSLVAVLGLFATSMSAPASACDGEKNAATPTHAAAPATAKVETVSLEGRVVTSGCPLEAAKANCTGTSLVVGETRHPIKKSAKGSELASKARDTDKLVKVTGTSDGDFLTVTGYQIKG